MTCPNCHCYVLDMNCETCDDLIELSGKMMSDDIEDPDSHAMEVWYKSGLVQHELIF